MNTYFAVRRGFGTEGHGKAIEYGPYTAENVDEAERLLLDDLEIEFGGLASGKLSDCGISGKSFQRAAELCGADYTQGF